MVARALGLGGVLRHRPDEGGGMRPRQCAKRPDALGVVGGDQPGKLAAPVPCLHAVVVNINIRPLTFLDLDSFWRFRASFFFFCS